MTSTMQLLLVATASLIASIHGFGVAVVGPSSSCRLTSRPMIISSFSPTITFTITAHRRSTTWLAASDDYGTDGTDTEEPSMEGSSEEEGSVSNYHDETETEDEVLYGDGNGNEDEDGDEDQKEQIAEIVEEAETKAETETEEAAVEMIHEPVEPVDIVDIVPEESAAPMELDTKNVDPAALIQSLFRLASITGRGEFATPSQHDDTMQLVAALEPQNPTYNPTFSSEMIQGRWELVYSNTQLFRSSPFFMSGRAVCETDEQAQQYDWFCDMHRAALAMSQIGAVRQIISSTRMISEFEVKAATVPFLSDFTPFSYSGGWPIAIEGAIVSSADLTPTGDAWEIYMDTVEIKGSNLPGVRQILDNGLVLQSRELAKVLEDNISSYETPRPLVTTTYLSDEVRISKDDDGKVFVYTKTSSDTEPTDYSNRMSDLGVSKLLEGFNDAILKFYI